MAVPIFRVRLDRSLALMLGVRGTIAYEVSSAEAAPTLGSVLRTLVHQQGDRLHGVLMEPGGDEIRPNVAVAVGDVLLQGSGAWQTPLRKTGEITVLYVIMPYAGG